MKNNLSKNVQHSWFVAILGARDSRKIQQTFTRANIQLVQKKETKSSAFLQKRKEDKVQGHATVRLDAEETCTALGQGLLLLSAVCSGHSLQATYHDHGLATVARAEQACPRQRDALRGRGGNGGCSAAGSFASPPPCWRSTRQRVSCHSRNSRRRAR